MLRFVRWYINCPSEVTDIVKDMLKNPYNVIYVIFDVFLDIPQYRGPMWIHTFIMA